MKDPGADQPQDQQGAGNHHYKSQCRSEQSLDGIGDEHHRNLGILHRNKEQEYADQAEQHKLGNGLSIH